ncbi:MAG: hypothetical protein WCF12_12560 [Propionicimonas sp.]
MSTVEIVGWLGALTATLLGMPQAWRLIRTRNIEGLSLVAWQANLVINIGWTAHGIVINQWNMIIPNALAMSATLPILILMQRELGLSLFRVLLPGVLGGAAMIVVDLLAGSAAYGAVALIPALLANAGQSVALVRSPRVVGVSPGFLVTQVINQLVWLIWAVLLPDTGTQIAAIVTGCVAVFNLAWWLLRQFGLRAFAVREPTADPDAAPISFDT